MFHFGRTTIEELKVTESTKRIRIQNCTEVNLSVTFCSCWRDICSSVSEMGTRRATRSALRMRKRASATTCWHQKMSRLSQLHVTDVILHLQYLHTFPEDDDAEIHRDQALSGIINKSRYGRGVCVVSSPVEADRDFVLSLDVEQALRDRCLRWTYLSAQVEACKKSRSIFMIICNASDFE